MPEITQQLGFDATKAMSTLGRLTKKLNEANSALAQFQNTASKGQANLTGVSNGLKKTEKRASELTVSWKTMLRVVQTQLIVRGLAAVIENMKDAVASAKELGLAIEEIQTISGRTQSSAQLTKQILALSDAMGKDARDAAEGYYQVLSNQVKGAGDAEGATKLLTDAMKLATVTASETKDAVNAISSVLNAYGQDASEATRVSGLLFKTVELGRLRLSEFANIIGKVTPLTAELGVEFEEVSAILATMTRQGVKVNIAVTQLRAIMTKMVKPTKEMQKLFRKWGVVDAEQAIDAFGGLVNVLKKMSQETGGSSEEMAKYINRVRALVGVMGTLAEDGEQVADTINKMGDSTNNFLKQWDEFQKSDAKRLNDATVELENTLTRLGIAALPKITVAAEKATEAIKGMEIITKMLTGRWDEAAQAEFYFAQNAQRHRETIEQMEARHVDMQKQRYADLTSTMTQYYIGIQQEEFKAQEIRDAALERANSKLKQFADGVVGLYSGAAGELESFLSSIGSKMRSEIQSITDLQMRLDNNALQFRLDRARSVMQKLRILEEAYGRARAKAARDAAAFASTGDQKAKDRALRELKIAERIAQQGRSMSLQLKTVRSRSKWEDAIQRSLKEQQNIHKQQYNLLPKLRERIEEISDQFSDGKRELQALADEWQRIIKSGDLEAGDAIQRNAEQRVDAIKDRMEQIFKEAAKHDPLLKALGIDTDFGRLSQKLSTALDKVHKNWEAEVAIAQAAFAKMELTFKPKIDPSGTLQAVADALDLTRDPKEPISKFAQRVDEKTIAAAKELDNIEAEILRKRVQVSQLLELAPKQLREANAVEQQELSHVLAVRGALAAAARLRDSSLTKAQAQVQAEQSLLQAYQSRNSLAITLANTLQQQQERLRSGIEISQQELTATGNMIVKARELNQITEVQADKYRAVLDAVGAANVKVAESVALEKQKQPEKETNAIRARVGYMEQFRAATEQTVTLEQYMAEAAERAKLSTQGTANAARQATEAQNQQTEAAQGTANATDTIGKSAQAQVGAVNTLTAAYNRLAAAAARAARAAAGARGGGGFVYHGGSTSRFFASGGLVRGQDRTLISAARGETIVNRKASSRFFSQLSAMNQGSQPVFREQGGTVTNVGDVNVTVNGGDSSQQTVREIGQALRREIQRGNIKLR